MKIKSLSLILAAILCVFFLSNVAFGWKITKELKKELNEKLKAVEEHQNDPMAHFDLAITYAYTNHVEEGWNELKKVHELDKNFAREALGIYRDAVIYDPNNWKLHFRYAFALYFNDMRSEAIAELKRVLELDRKNVWAYGYIGLLFGEMGKIDTGISWINKGLKIDSDVAALHMLLSSAYYKKDNSWGGFWEGVEALRLKALGY